MIKKKRNTEEHDEQVILCKYLDLLKLDYFAVPNGMYLRGTSKLAISIYMRKMKDEGFKKGVQDLLVFLPNFMLFIEMKNKSGGAVSPEQKYWKDKVNKYSYAKAVICAGFQDAKTIIDNELRR